VLEQFTQKNIAARTVDVYREMIEAKQEAESASAAPQHPS
jgi:hypothetical protein